MSNKNNVRDDDLEKNNKIEYLNRQFELKKIKKKPRNEKITYRHQSKL